MLTMYPRVNSQVKRKVNLQDISFRRPGATISAMDIFDTRRANLRRLINLRFNRKQAAFAAAIERQPDYVSRILKGKKNVGEEFARMVETRLGLPPLSLDRADHLTPTDTDLLTEMAQLSPENRAAIRHIIKSLLRGQQATDAAFEKTDGRTDGRTDGAINVPDNGS